MADKLPGLTIVLPCLDEAENLADAVRCATDAGERCALEHEIVVVDDGSTDATTSLAAALATRNPRVRLVVHAENRGYGEALRSGVAAARMPWVLLTDADLQYDLTDLAGFLAAAHDAELVVGRRILPQVPPGRRAADAVWRRFIGAVLRLGVHDADCAFRLARRDLLARLDLRAGGALVGPELLVKSRAAGARVAEIPVRHRVRVAGRGAGAGRRLTSRTGRELRGLRLISRG
jgi:glycosyltransferase involved in cell wall biosynthesis